TVLLTTQHLEEADQLAGRISIMKAGRIIAEDTPAALKHQHGGDRVEITVPRDLDRLPGAFVVTDEEAGVVTYPAPGGARDLIEVVRLLDAAGITPEDISLRRPTLDEVFLALTEKEDA
ncbi:DUF4162 domain-containing protein, partial [Staphylococcus aureus]|uniref:ATP-binding protein DrrA1-3 family domain-containing protein n=1 Tax=Staphylococcus aureus TaxID=1280 RepID=UPI002022536D